MAWKLSNCRSDCDGQKVFIVSTDLSALNGLTLKGIVIPGANVLPGDCWAVTEEDDLPAQWELSSYEAFYTDCNYCICGCCTEGIPEASVCAELDLSDVDLDALGPDDNITINFIGATYNLVLGTVSGDLTGYTLLALCNAIVSAVDNGGSGFTASTNGIIVTICTPSSLGSEAIGSTVELIFSPQYYLKNEGQNTGVIADNPPYGGRTSLGYSAIGSKRPAFAPSQNLLYVPNSDFVQFVYPAPNVIPPGASTTSFMNDFTGASGLAATAYTVNIGQFLTTNFFTAGQRFGLSSPITDTGQATSCFGICPVSNPTGGNFTWGYTLIVEITGTGGNPTGYNPATGQLDFIVISWGNNFEGTQVPAALFPTNTPAWTPVCCTLCTCNPGDPTLSVGTLGGTGIGLVPWTFAPLEEGWGTVSIMDVDLVTGAVTMNRTIEVPVSSPWMSVYDPVSDSVYVSGLGAGTSKGAVVKIDLGIDPFVVDSSVNLNLNSTAEVDVNSFTNLITPISQAAFVSKLSASLQFNAPSTIALFGQTGALYHSFDPTNGVGYFAQGVNLMISYITPAAIPAYNSIDTATSAYFPVFNYVTPFVAFTGDPLLDQILQPCIQNIGDIHYCKTCGLNGKLFVTRLIKDIVPSGSPTPQPVSHGYILQVYDLSYGSAAAITNGVVNLTPPSGPLGTFNYLGANIEFQPSDGTLFIPSYFQQSLHIFDMVTETFLSSIVSQPHQLIQASYTDDSTQPDFFLYGGANWISVVSKFLPSQTLFGIFTGDLNCSPCLPEEEEFYQRTIPDPVKIFYQIAESNCDLGVIKKFANAYWNKVKEDKYGVTTCCQNVPIEQLWLDYQLTSLSMMLIPDITCTPVPGSTCCSPWLPTRTCELIPDPTGGNSILGTAGEDILFSKVVMLSADGKFYLNDPSDVLTYQRCVGFASQGAVTNQQIRVLISGQLINTGWSLIPGALYYASSSGSISSAVPTSGISQVVGIALSFNTLLVEIRQPIIL